MNLVQAFRAAAMVAGLDTTGLILRHPDNSLIVIHPRQRPVAVYKTGSTYTCLDMHPVCCASVSTIATAVVRLILERKALQNAIVNDIVTKVAEQLPDFEISQMLHDNKVLICCPYVTVPLSADRSAPDMVTNESTSKTYSRTEAQHEIVADIVQHIHACKQAHEQGHF